jgi:uncharacterized protein
MPTVSPEVILLPGYGATIEQPFLLKVCAQLQSRGLVCERLKVPSRPLDEALSVQTAFLNSFLTERNRPVWLLGRSFGARVVARCAFHSLVRGLVLVSYPVQSPKKPRPYDEQILRSLNVRALFISGTDDALGPPAVLQACANPESAFHWLPGAKHSLGRFEDSAVQAAADFILKYEKLALPVREQ